MLEPRYVAFAVASACPRCDRLVPLAPMQPSAACSDCRNEFELSDKLWIHLVRIAEDLDERLSGRDAPIEGQRLLAGVSVHYAIWRQPPICERCGSELAHAATIEGAPHSSICPGCGEPAIDFPVPGKIAAAIAAAKQVFVCDPQRFAAAPTRRTWTLRLRGMTPAQRRRALEQTRARGRDGESSGPALERRATPGERATTQPSPAESRPRARVVLVALLALVTALAAWLGLR
ncbi:hypothetical protein ACNOYE_23025 [Nannocystaceae bacterium ST9]